MKLLILTDGIAPFVIGGMQKHSYELAKNLALLGHQITLVHCVYGKHSMPTQDELATAFGAEASSNLEFISMRFPAASWYPGHYIKESYIYSHWIYDKLKDRLSTFDFIYAKGFTAWYFLDKKNRGQKMPPIGIKFHGYEMLQEPGNWKMRLHNMILKSPTIWNNRHADFVFSYGGKITRIISDLGISSHKIIEIPTGIESSWIREKLTKTSEDKIRFVFVGRYERRKGVEEIHQSLMTLQTEKHWEFHFIGPIPPSVRLKKTEVIYHGPISDKNEIRKILDQSAVLVAPSHSEGMPNVIMEAMARGLAILTTDVGAISSVVSAENGWFVQPGDVSSLQNQLQKILNMETAQLLQLREASLRKIQQYSWDKIAAITADRIRGVCN